MCRRSTPFARRLTASGKQSDDDFDVRIVVIGTVAREGDHLKASASLTISGLRATLVDDFFR
jgi:hypothetical protein